MNFYSYAANSPGSFVDPLGLAIEDCLSGLSSGLLGGLGGGLIAGFAFGVIATISAPVAAGLGAALGVAGLVFVLYQVSTNGPCWSSSQWSEYVCGAAGGAVGAVGGGFLGAMAGRGAATAMGLGGKPPLPVPKPSNKDLQNLVKDLYKGTKSKNPVGTGSTADAIRNERVTGLPTNGKYHTQKGEEYTTALTKWLTKNPNASHYDRLVAESLKYDLEHALGMHQW